MGTTRSTGCIWLLSSVTLLLSAWTAPAAAQVTTRVSVDSSGAQGNYDSAASSISADGRYVAFSSAASNLVAGDTNDCSDMFVHDRQSGTTERVSVGSGGAQGNGACGFPSVSADGRYVAFESFASNLVAGDTNGYWDIFVHDRQNGTTERVSVATGGAQGNGECGYRSSVSADGRYVAFESFASNLVAGDTNDWRDVFVHDRQLGVTERVSVNSGGAEGDYESRIPSISADGRYVAFCSPASNLVAGDTNADWDVFVHDRQSGTTERVSISSAGAQGNDHSTDSSVSADGRYVAFQSAATTLVAGDTNSFSDVFVRDRLSGATERVSVATGGAQGNGSNDVPSISTDGRYVAFQSFASNLVTDDTNGWADVFVHDRQSGTTERVSVATGGAQGNVWSTRPSISAAGRFVAFDSLASNFVALDTNGGFDVFVRDRDGIGTKYCTANANSTGSPADIWATGSASSAAGDLMLVSAPVPNQNGVFFHGVNATQVPFGNGFLCTNGNVTRGAVILGAGNLATYVYDNSDAKHSVAAFINTTRHFQYWFRDPMGGGALFNTSNAIAILILP